MVIFGIEPKEIDGGMELTSEIEEVIPQVADLVLAEIARQVNQGKSG